VCVENDAAECPVSLVVRSLSTIITTTKYIFVYSSGF